MVAGEGGGGEVGQGRGSVELDEEVEVVVGACERGEAHADAGGGAAEVVLAAFQGCFREDVEDLLHARDGEGGLAVGVGLLPPRHGRGRQGPVAGLGVGDEGEVALGEVAPLAVHLVALPEERGTRGLDAEHLQDRRGVVDHGRGPVDRGVGPQGPRQLGGVGPRVSEVHPRGGPGDDVEAARGRAGADRDVGDPGDARDGQAAEVLPHEGLDVVRQEPFRHLR